MTLRFDKCLWIGLLAAVTWGCEPQPVVVDPDGDDTTIIERDDDPDTVVMPSPDSGTDVDVGIEGGKGVEVDVDRDAE